MLGQPTIIGPDQYQNWWTQTIPVLPGTFVNFAQSFAPQGPTNPDLNRTDTNFSFKVGVDWKLSDDVLTYLTFSQGYRGAAFNSLAFNGPNELTLVEPEKLDSYEIGVKAELMERRVEVNAAVFHYNYTNQQFLDLYCAFPTAGGGCGGTGFITSNAPKSSVTGGEVELRAKPTAALDLRASVGVLSSKYDQLFLRFADRSGNKLIMAPDLSVGMSADWRAAQLSAGDVHLSVNANYYSKQYYDALNTERIAQPGYAVVNARASLIADAPARHRWWPDRLRASLDPQR
jgi:iron complex outermembrane receptor protein